MDREEGRDRETKEARFFQTTHLKAANLSPRARSHSPGGRALIYSWGVHAHDQSPPGRPHLTTLSYWGSNFNRSFGVDKPHPNHSTAHLCLLIRKRHLFTFKATTAEDLLLSFCSVSYMPYSFFHPSFLALLSSFIFSWFFIVECLNSFLVSFCVCSVAILFVVTMGITFNILKLLRCTLNIYQLNFGNRQNSAFMQLYPHTLSVIDVVKSHLYTLCVQKHRHIYILMH